RSNLSNKHQMFAGVLLGIAALLKIYPFGFILFYAWKKRYRLVICGCAVVCLVLVLSGAALGLQAVNDYWHLMSVASGPTFVATPWSFGFSALAYRALAETAYATPFVTVPEFAVRAVIAL